MAVAVLSPWPTTPAALTAARACLKAALGSGLADDRADAIGSTASSIVERYAPSAPQVVRNEATIRLAGWLQTSARGDIIPTAVGGITFTWRPTIGRNALRQSGAMGLLSLWHKPRALVLEESDE